MKFKTILFLVVSIMVVFFVGCEGDSDYEELSKSTMEYLDTEIQIMLYTKDSDKAEEVINDAFGEIERLESILSRHVPESDVKKINQNAGIDKVEVNSETIELVNEAIKWGEKTQGHFDVTVAPLMNRWGFDEDRTYEKIGREDDNGELLVDFEIPTNEEIEGILEHVNYQLIEVDEEKKTVYLPDEDMQLEMAGIAKGYILESALEILREEGMEHAFIRAGGDITTLGNKPDDEPWIIAIRNPREEGFFATFHLDDKSIGTAGDYVRYFELDGDRYSHILNPLEGQPARGIVSATVEAPTAIEIDVISTTAFVMGKEKGLDFIENMEEVEVALVDEEGTVHYSSGFDESLTEDAPDSGDKIF